MPKIVLANQCFVPESMITRDDLQRWYYEWEEDVVEDKLDENGVVIFDGDGKPMTVRTKVQKSLKTYEWVVDDSGRRWVGLPRGNFNKVRPLLRANRKDVVDLRCHAPLDLGMAINKSTRSDPRWKSQKDAVKEWLQYGWGIIRGEPGSGKTTMGIAAIAAVKQRTLILSARRDGNTHWINQLRKHTNLQEIEELEGRELVGVYKAKRNRIWPITVVTVQSFLHDKGHGRLAELQQKFGMVLIDEVHEFGSPKFSYILSCTNPRYILGVTATPKRSDRKHHLVYDLVGPVVAQAKSKQMKPKVTFILTGVMAPEWIYKQPFPPHYRWQKCLETLVASEKRYDIIIRELLRDIERGRIIACVSERREVVQRLFSTLCDRGVDNVAYVDGGTKNREAIYESVRDGQVQVLCAGKVLNALVDIAVLDCIHLVTPVNNEKSVKQIYGRGNRWFENKVTPEVKDYVDQGGQLTGAFKNRNRICLENDWQTEVIDGARSSFWK